MLNRLILKVTKFKLPPLKRLGTVVKNILGGGACKVILKFSLKAHWFKFAKFSRTDMDHQKLRNKFCFWPGDKAFRPVKKFYELRNFTNTNRKVCPKCSFFNLMNRQTRVKRKVAFFIEYSRTKKSKYCCQPPFHPPICCRHSLNLLSPTLPKIIYCLIKISIRAKRLISPVFFLFIVPSPFFVHCPYKGRINRAGSVLTGLKPY